MPFVPVDINQHQAGFGARLLQSGSARSRHEPDLYGAGIKVGGKGYVSL
jgi:hypothetical protein